MPESEASGKSLGPFHEKATRDRIPPLSAALDKERSDAKIFTPYLFGTGPPPLLIKHTESMNSLIFCLNCE